MRKIKNAQIRTHVLRIYKIIVIRNSNLQWSHSTNTTTDPNELFATGVYRYNNNSNPDKFPSNATSDGYLTVVNPEGSKSAFQIWVHYTGRTFLRTSWSAGNGEWTPWAEFTTKSDLPNVMLADETKGFRVFSNPDNNSRYLGIQSFNSDGVIYELLCTNSGITLSKNVNNTWTTVWSK